jgi:hypothetical protein
MGSFAPNHSGVTQYYSASQSKLALLQHPHLQDSAGNHFITGRFCPQPTRSRNRYSASKSNFALIQHLHLQESASHHFLTGKFCPQPIRRHATGIPPANQNASCYNMLIFKTPWVVLPPTIQESYNYYSASQSELALLQHLHLQESACHHFLTGKFCTQPIRSCNRYSACQSKFVLLGRSSHFVL